jgi:hypothetical protein
LPLAFVIASLSVSLSLWLSVLKNEQCLYAQVRLEGIDKENLDLKYKIHSITKELEIRSAELEYGKKTSEVLSRHHADSVKKIVRLEDECNRLRIMVRKKLPSMRPIPINLIILRIILLGRNLMEHSNVINSLFYRYRSDSSHEARAGCFGKRIRIRLWKVSPSSFVSESKFGGTDRLPTST